MNTTEPKIRDQFGSLVDNPNYRPTAGVSVNDQMTANDLAAKLPYRNAATPFTVKEVPNVAPEIQFQAQQYGNMQRPVDMNGVYSSSASVVQGERDITRRISTMFANNSSEGSAYKASQDYIKTLDDETARLEKRRADAIAAIEASYAQKEEKLKGAQTKEVGTTNVALQRIGGYLGNTVSATGALINLGVTHRGEISALESEKQAKIQEANDAIDGKQFEYAKLKAKEIKDIEKEINDRRSKFFEESMSIIREQRLQESEDRMAEKSAFDKSVSITDRIAPTVVEALASMDNEAQATDYLRAVAKDNGVDPDLLLGKVNDIMADRREKETTQVFELGKKYLDAGITPQDTFTSAAEKVRASKSYKLDVMKSETDIANAQSLIRSRAEAAAGVDYSSPIMSLYTKATGEIVSSPSQARAIEGYAEGLLGDKEIIADEDVKEGTQLLENQIKASDAQKILSQAFTQLNKAQKTEIPDKTIWQWLGSTEAQNMIDDKKIKFIMDAGKNPEDFGVF